MPNIKVTDFDPSTLKTEHFANVSSYRRFVKGLMHVIEAQKIKDGGGMLFVDGQPLEAGEDFVIGEMAGTDFKQDLPVFGTGSLKGGMYMWLGCTFCGETGKVWVEKEEMEIFNKISYVLPKNIKKLRNLR